MHKNLTVYLNKFSKREHISLHSPKIKKWDIITCSLQKLLFTITQELLLT